MGGNDTTQSKRGIDSLFALRLEEKDVNFPAKPHKDSSYVAKKVTFPLQFFTQETV